MFYGSCISCNVWHVSWLKYMKLTTTETTSLNNLFILMFMVFRHCVRSSMNWPLKIPDMKNCKEQGPLHIENTLLSRDLFTFIERMKMSKLASCSFDSTHTTSFCWSRSSQCFVQLSVLTASKSTKHILKRDWQKEQCIEVFASNIIIRVKSVSQVYHKCGL